MIRNGCAAVGNTFMPYVSFGKGKRKLVVLPGLSDGLSTVKGKAILLAPPYRRFFRDYTVYMFSRKWEMQRGYSIRDMSEDQIRVLKEMGIQQADLLGVSQGGMIAQYMAIDHPEMIHKLVLAVTAPNANPVVQEALNCWIDMAERGDHTSLMIDTAERMYSDPYLQKNRRLFPLLARFTRPKDYERFFINARAILGFDCRSTLQRISCPTLILAGSDDRTVGGEAAYELHRAIPDSELFVYEGLGHGVFEEAKDFYERVREFYMR